MNPKDIEGKDIRNGGYEPWEGNERVFLETQVHNLD